MRFEGLTRDEAARAVLERLAPVLREEGLDLEIAGVEGDTLLVEGHRWRAGAPAAFLVKALEGTFRRYYPSIRTVRLVSYRDDTSAAAASTSLRPSAPSGRGVPVLDLSGLDRRRAGRALSVFLAMEARRGTSALVLVGLEEEQARRAAAQVLGILGNAHHALDEGSDALVVHLGEPCEDGRCLRGARLDDPMPARILLTDPADSPGAPPPGREPEGGRGRGEAAAGGLPQTQSS